VRSGGDYKPLLTSFFSLIGVFELIGVVAHGLDWDDDMQSTAARRLHPRGQSQRL
jgi:hypothetical protein